MTPLSRAAIVRLLGHLHNVPPAREGALIGRLQHLQRMNFPRGVNVGSGKRAEYNLPSIVKLLLAFELMQFGLGPERVKGVLNYLRWGPIAWLGGRAGRALATGIDPREAEDGTYDLQGDLLALDPKGLVSLEDPHDKGEAAGATVRLVLVEDPNEDLEEPERDVREATIDVTRLLIRASIHLNDEEGVPFAEFGNALLEWANAQEWPEND